MFDNKHFKGDLMLICYALNPHGISLIYLCAKLLVNRIK